MTGCGVAVMVGIGVAARVDVGAGVIVETVDMGITVSLAVNAGD